MGQYLIEVIIVLPLLLYPHTCTVGSVGSTALHTQILYGRGHTVGGCYSDVHCLCFLLQRTEAAVGRLVLQTHTQPLLQDYQPPGE